jgi:triosephosphate isomerase
MRKRYLIGNLKMNMSSPEEAEQYLVVLRREAHGKSWERTEVVIAPPFVHLDRFAKKLPTGIHLGAQNVFPEKEGAYTGEISVSMLKGEKAGFVIVGHSERRLYAGETDEIVAQKVRAALKGGLVPVLCVGETEEERKKNVTVESIEEQITSAFEGISPLQAEKIIIAYEPRWAIGSDVTPSSEDILQVRVVIIRAIGALLSLPLAEKISILYGGSVKTTLLEQVCFRAQMDGVLVGRESLFPSELVRMADALESYEPPQHGAKTEAK